MCDGVCLEPFDLGAFGAEPVDPVDVPRHTRVHQGGDKGVPGGDGTLSNLAAHREQGVGGVQSDSIGDDGVCLEPFDLVAFGGISPKAEPVDP